ncbi:hypothetical protein NA56DRAFT_190526 [Hyaloscypha hepaticicola]|uniref:Uncharacterized protein n=1 Tax=Hyaloscypha hepaticicola TaxID=2082293 RepID=A0A2J6Q0V9_9HELO|nr:hypothetical protein NA56DRAFT_190526 [Hyaloscypha hepaticicola]
MNGIAKCGVCSEEDWPFDLDAINDRPSDEAIGKVVPHTIKAFYCLDPDRPERNNHTLTVQDKDKLGAVVLDNLRNCLAKQYRVVFGFWYYLPVRDSFNESQIPFVRKDVWAITEPIYPRHTFSSNLPPELRIRNKSGEVGRPGYNILAIGYDDVKQAVLIQNSLGPSWSGNGTFWMPYAWITDFAATSDFWTIRSSNILIDTTSKKWEDVYREILGTM